ncbi:hypothetical protein K491DRAFT_719131 [Lophiostoma macrostomum CBS 122681]|uniref:Zn(2)-C6 fungal-type domain-containing protein n=1 Tax=Lophiostoma macrostomum CBS 122681 TaxID=1314788 RepID=A0A6A6SYU0_9PLEO|nr:hypothetical protein K491DRAFT_719131 [Lophiostoma macrostomum CBS 122681]
MYNSFSASSNDSNVGEQYSQRPEPARGRPKRHQVARACAWCRTYRIKCDANYPCKNCKEKGRNCTVEKGKPEVRTFPHAIKEIDRLKERIKELEEQLSNSNLESTVRPEQTQEVSGDVKARLPPDLDPFRQHGANRKYYNWDYISTQTAYMNQQSYGSSSPMYFIAQIESHFKKELRQGDHPEVSLATPSRSFLSPLARPKIEASRKRTHQNEQPSDELDLSRSQEEDFLNIYWKTYHRIYYIIDEAMFNAHYNSLWEETSRSRKPSALVDIVVALCMQYHAASTPMLHSSNKVGTGDYSSTVAGRSFLRRCQALLTDELEGPSLSTFQCYPLITLWLSQASFQNTAHSVLAMGIRMGIVLGLHLEPAAELDEKEKEFHKRLWWTVYALEMNMAMEFGRPLAVTMSQVTCSIPGQELSIRKDMTTDVEHQTRYLNALLVKLILATRAVYVSYHKRIADLFRSHPDPDFKDNREFGMCVTKEGREDAARTLKSLMKYMKTWVQQVRQELKSARTGNGEAFSTDRSTIDIRLLFSTSYWLPEHRIVLELSYLYHCMNLYRSFIFYSQGTSSELPVMGSHAISCVNYAIAITNMIHQILTETDLLRGWHDVFQYQWNAMLVLTGYCIAYPIGPSAPAAREALSTAITVFELPSSGFASALSAAGMARDLASKADLVIARFRTGLTAGSPAAHSMIPIPSVVSTSFDFEQYTTNADLDILPSLTGDDFADFLTSAPAFDMSFEPENAGDINLEDFDAFDFLSYEEAPGL